MGFEGGRSDVEGGGRQCVRVGVVWRWYYLRGECEEANLKCFRRGFAQDARQPTRHAFEKEKQSRNNNTQKDGRGESTGGIQNEHVLVRFSASSAFPKNKSTTSSCCRRQEKRRVGGGGGASVEACASVPPSVLLSLSSSFTRSPSVLSTQIKGRRAHARVHPCVRWAGRQAREKKKALPQATLASDAKGEVSFARTFFLFNSSIEAGSGCGGFEHSTAAAHSQTHIHTATQLTTLPRCRQG